MSNSPLPLWNYFFAYFGALVVMVLLLIIIVPLLYRKVITERWQSTRARVTATVALCGLCWLIAYGDVLVIAIIAQRLCHEETGTKVFKTVETDGFLGGTSIANWSSYGFSYVEYWVGTYYRLTMVAGKEVEERIAAPSSRYERTYESTGVAFQVVRNTDLVRDRTTSEILGEVSSFAIFPGWADSLFLGLTGFSWSPPLCMAPDHKPRPGAGADSDDLIKKTLKPVHAN